MIWLAVFALAAPAYGQQPQDVPGLVYEEGLAQAPTTGIAPPDLERFKQDDPEHYYSWFAKAIFGDWDMQNTGQWVDLSNGDRVWQVRFTAPGATSLHVFFDQYQLPAGAYLIAFDEDKMNFVGPYTAADNRDHQEFMTNVIPGETIILQYYEPKHVAGLAKLHINRIDYGYEVQQRVGAEGDIFKAKGNAPGDAQSCTININCDGNIGDVDIWQKMKKSVVRLVIPFGGGSGNCSGTLLNNTALDQRLLLFSAFHCQGGGTVNYNNLKCDFQYEHVNGNGCEVLNPQPTIARETTGAVELAKGSDSDFWLFEITDDIPNDVDVIFAGWDRSDGSGKPATTGISHPRGDVKKIHKQGPANSQGVNVGGVNFPNNSHWGAQLTDGLIEPGSSGSSMMLDNGLVVGVLHAGSGMDCSASSTFSFYGKVSWAWENQGASASGRLKDWLDPIGTANGTNSPIVLDLLDPTEAASDIIISEFVEANANAGTPSYIEIYNTSPNKSYNIGSVVLNVYESSATSPVNSINIPDGTIIAPRRTFVVASGAFPAGFGYNPNMEEPGLSLEGNQSIVLFNETTNETLDTYGDPGTLGGDAFWDYAGKQVIRRSFVYQNNSGEFEQENFYEWQLSDLDINQLTPGSHTAQQAAYDLAVSDVLSPSDQSDATVCDNRISPVIEVSNFGRNNIRGFDVHFVYEDLSNNVVSAETIFLDEFIGSEESEVFDLADYDFSMPMNSGSTYRLQAFTVNPSSQTDEVPFNDTTNMEVTINERVGEVITLELRTDFWGNETTWEIIRSGVVIASGGPYAAGFTETYTIPICVDPLSCFTFRLRDDASDGIDDPGYFLIKNAAGDTLVDNANFFTNFVEEFCLFETPEAPTNIQVIGQQGMTATIGWDHNSTNETGYEIEREFVNLASGWEFAGSVPKGILQFTDTVALTKQATTYRVRAVLEVDDFQAASEWEEMVGSVTALQDQLDAQIRLYPNPADDLVRVSFGDLTPQAAQLSLFDVAGREVLRQSVQVDAGQLSLNVSAIPAGIYTLRMALPEGTITRQFIIR